MTTYNDIAETQMAAGAPITLQLVHELAFNMLAIAAGDPSAPEFKFIDSTPLPQPTAGTNVIAQGNWVATVNAGANLTGLKLKIQKAGQYKIGVAFGGENLNDSDFTVKVTIDGVEQSNATDDYTLAVDAEVGVKVTNNHGSTALTLSIGCAVAINEVATGCIAQNGFPEDNGAIHTDSGFSLTGGGTTTLITSGNLFHVTRGVTEKRYDDNLTFTSDNVFDPVTYPSDNSDAFGGWDTELKEVTESRYRLLSDPINEEDNGSLMRNYTFCRSIGK